MCIRLFPTFVCLHLLCLLLRLPSTSHPFLPLAEMVAYHWLHEAFFDTTPSRRVGCLSMGLHASLRSLSPVMLHFSYLPVDCELTSQVHRRHLWFLRAQYRNGRESDWALPLGFPWFPPLDFQEASVTVQGAGHLTLPASSQPSLPELESDPLPPFPVPSPQMGLPAHLIFILLGSATILVVGIKFMPLHQASVAYLYLWDQYLQPDQVFGTCSDLRVILLSNPGRCTSLAFCSNHVPILTPFSTCLDIW